MWDRVFFYEWERNDKPPIQWRVPGVLSQGVEWLGCEADHSPPSIAEVNNDGPMPPLPDTSLWCGS
jgi:hypothetical protein